MQNFGPHTWTCSVIPSLSQNMDGNLEKWCCWSHEYKDHPSPSSSAPFDTDEGALAVVEVLFLFGFRKKWFTSSLMVPYKPCRVLSVAGEEKPSHDVYFLSNVDLCEAELVQTTDLVSWWTHAGKLCLHHTRPFSSRFINVCVVYNLPDGERQRSGRGIVSLHPPHPAAHHVVSSSVWEELWLTGCLASLSSLPLLSCHWSM